MNISTRLTMLMTIIRALATVGRAAAGGGRRRAHRVVVVLLAVHEERTHRRVERPRLTADLHAEVTIRIHLEHTACLTQRLVKEMVTGRSVLQVLFIVS